MGIYLNTNSELLRESMNSEIYIDKSLIIRELNRMIKTERKFVCVSRPRRFGKSMASDLISSYYGKNSDSLELFKQLKIYKDESFEKHYGKYNVIKMDINGMFRTHGDIPLMQYINKKVVAEIRENFPSAKVLLKDSLDEAMLKVYTKTGEQFVIIMDEYDVLIREEVPDEEFRKYLTFLNGLFKNRQLKPAIAMAYLTGILPIVRDKVESKLNEFAEFNMLNAGRLAEFVGFTAEEVAELCAKYSMDLAECKRWYDGYRITKTLSVFNPKSVVEAMFDQEFASHWSNTGSFENIKDYIELDFEGIRDDVAKMLGGGRVAVDVLSFLNTKSSFKCKDDVYSYLIHLGYLTYDKDTKECYIPNYEVREQWVLAIKLNPNFKKVLQIIYESKSLLEATLRGDTEFVENFLEDAHSKATNPLTYNDEKSFQAAMGLAYFYAYSEYTIIKEMPSGKGYADIGFIPVNPRKPALIIELKADTTTADGALNQIRERKYHQALENYYDNLLFVGVTYNKETKKHSCKIEKFG